MTRKSAAKPSTTARVIALSTMVIAAAIAACSREGEKAPAAVGEIELAETASTVETGTDSSATIQAGDESSEAPEEASLQETPEDAGASPPNASTSVPKTPPPRLVGGMAVVPRDFGSPITPFVLSSSGKPLYPSDFSLGPLATLGGDASPAATAAARLVLDALAKGTMPEGLYQAERYLLLSSRMRPYLSSPSRIVSWRLGVATLVGPSAFFNIRLYSALGRAEGELVLELLDGAWYVTDMRADLDSLSRAWAGSGRLFMPDYYEQFER